IFIVYETGISYVQIPGETYAPIGMKQVGKATSAESNQNVTVVRGLSATGIYVPSTKSSLRIGGPPECSEIGRIKEEFLMECLYHFATNISLITKSSTPRSIQSLQPSIAGCI
ncbi:hypothetical protein HHI36_004003, partial [Cryptolaemus montrouzieri]